MKITPDSLVQKASQLYSLPSVYTELDRKINDPLSNLEDVASILLNDPALSARLLKIANSSMYNFPSKIDTITRAVTIIGTKQLRDLALATSVIALFDGIDPSKIDMEAFWRHSIAVGITARTIATYQAATNVERFYLLGLLHDIGRLIMLTQIPEVMTDLIDRCSNQQLLYEQEKKVLGFEHGEVGQLLLKSWNLPIQITEAVGHHHNPLHSKVSSHEAAIVHVADILVSGIQLGSSNGTSLVPPLNEKAWKSIGLSSAITSDLLELVETQYRSVVEIFLS